MSSEEQLLKAVFHDTYRLERPEQVLHWLRRLRDRARLLTAYPERGGDLRVTAIVELDERTGVVHIDGFDGCCPESGDAPTFRLLGREGGVYVGLKGRALVTDGQKGGLYRFDHGGHIWIMQRRAHFRAQMPPGASVFCEFILEDGQAFKMRLDDVSQGGIGGTLTMQDFDSSIMPFEPGKPVTELRFTLPGETDIRCAGRIANVREVSRGSRRDWVIGVQFDGLSLPCERLISRYVRTRERVQRQRDRGY